MTGYTLDFRFVRSPGLVSWLIDRSTGGFLAYRGPRWSHVGVLVRGGDVRSLGPAVELEDDAVYEFGARYAVDGALAARPGVQFRPEAYAGFAATETVRVPVTSHEWIAFWCLALKTEGAAYSERTVEGFVEGVNVPGRPRELAFDCSTLGCWLALHGCRELIPPEFQGELRQMSPNGFYYVARMSRFYRSDAVTA
ncbi:MAG TPA: hypothetical protein VHW66_18920 [Stellaceae bacterium]|jgi:hypothetical protein|nr:hypothetical protein [Stellaceae bacterium]